MRRFWDKVNKSTDTDCWLWLRNPTTEYGRFWYKGKWAKAHRVAWELTHGEIPKNFDVLHRCNVKKCVNPDHLYLGSHADNMVDMCSDYAPFGALNQRAKLYAGEIWLIRKLMLLKPENKSRLGYREYSIPAHLIAKMFKVSPQTIRNVWRTESFLCKEGYYL